MTKRRGRPATTPADREAQLIALSYDEAERQILRGEASSQVLTHFLKAGSQRDALEQRRLELDAELLRHKTEALKSAAQVAELYEAAMQAFAKYRGEE